MSSRFDLTIECANAAFADGNRNLELARILREVADKIEAGDPRLGSVGAVFDVNGNRVGECELWRR